MRASTTSLAAPETTSVERQPLVLPLLGFVFEVDSEFEVVRDLRGLTAVGDLLFAFTPPDTMLRIDPARQVVESLPAAAEVARIDPATDRVDTFGVEPGPGWIDADPSAVWVSHPPIASVSRLDPLTGDTIEVIDLDVSAGTVASARTGSLQVVDDGVWVIVSFPGSPHRNAFTLIDPSGAVVGARHVQFDSQTWEAVDGAIWIHRLDSASIIRSSLDDFDSASPTDEDDLLPIVVATTATTTPASTAASEDERALLAALEMVLASSVPAADLGLETQADARRDLIDLADAQAGLHIEPTSLIIDNETATTVFDVLIEGDTIILPAVELRWHRVDDRTWHLDPTSFCRFATGIGIGGCEP